MTTDQRFVLNQLDAIDSCSFEARELVKKITLEYETKIDILTNPDDYSNPKHDITVTKSLIRHYTGILKKEIDNMQYTLEEIEKELAEI